MKKRVVSLILAICMAVILLPGTARADQNGNGVAYPVEGGNIYFDKSTGTITDCDWSVRVANIPSSIEGVAVKRIGDDAFFFHDSLTSVVIPGSINSIGDYTFCNCYNLTSVIISNGITRVGDYAFCNCYNLTSAIIPDSVTYIGVSAFNECLSLTSVSIPSSILSVGDWAFWWCNSLLDVYYFGNETQWSTIDIGDYNDSLTGANIHYNSTGLSAKKAEFQGHTYQVFDTDVSWDDAKSECENMGGHLVTVNSVQEQVFLTELINGSSKKNMWIGAYLENGTFNWVTGETFTYTNWDSGEPNNVFNTQNAAMMYTNNASKTAGTWNDENGNGRDWDGYRLSDFGYICEWDEIAGDGNDGPADPTISDETVLRAKLLTKDHTFKYFRTTKSVVQIVANELDPIPSQAWYAIENYIDMYLEAIKQGKIYVSDAFEVTEVEFYEYLLFKLLDNKELNYMSLTKPFSLVDDITGGKISGSLLEKLTKAGFKAGTKITDENMKDLKDVCIAYCGTDGVNDIGILDTFLVAGKTVDEFLSEYTKYYELYTVSDAREEAIRLIGEASTIPELRTAAENVCKSIEKVKTLGVSYCLGEGAAAAGTDLDAWLMGKLIDTMCELHPVSKVWKATVDYTTFTMDTIFQTDDISTDTIYIIGMTNVENTLLNAIQRAEDAFLSDNSLENAQRYIALADTLQRDLIVGCDLATSLVDHTERGELNWHGLLDLIKMVSKKKFDFAATVKWMFGDENSDFSHIRKTIDHIKTNIKIADFYTGTVSALDLLQNPDSVTPSAWAKAEVDKAISYGILPEWVRTNYQSNITRLEFCALLEFMIDQKTGKTVLQLADELESVEGGQIKPPFDDALYTEANDIARLGIINGVGDNKFDPLGEITRQEAAIMLYRTADVLGYDTTSAPTDHTGVASWAVTGVDFVATKGIMNGTDRGFDPEGKLTKEQAILTLVRFYENVK